MVRENESSFIEHTLPARNVAYRDQKEQIKPNKNLYLQIIISELFPHKSGASGIRHPASTIYNPDNRLWIPEGHTLEILAPDF